MMSSRGIKQWRRHLNGKRLFSHAGVIKHRATKQQTFEGRVAMNTQTGSEFEHYVVRLPHSERGRQAERLPYKEGKISPLRLFTGYFATCCRSENSRRKDHRFRGVRDVLEVFSGLASSSRAFSSKITSP